MLETGCSVLHESVQLAIDFRQRPVAHEVFNQILSDFILIKQTFDSFALTRPISSLLKDSVFSQAPFFNLGTTVGKLMKVRDDLARTNDEGPNFICEDGLITHLIKNSNSDPATVIQNYYKSKYVPYYIQKNINKFKSVLVTSRGALPPKP